jgi:hypothetical protein
MRPFAKILWLRSDYWHIVDTWNECHTLSGNHLLVLQHSKMLSSRVVLRARLLSSRPFTSRLHPSLCVATLQLQRTPHQQHRRYSTQDNGGDMEMPAPVAESERLLLVTTCGKCDAPMRKSFSRQAYEKGALPHCP